MTTTQTTKCKFQCSFCETRFTRSIGPRTVEVRCPKCHEYDCWPIG